MIRLNGVIMFEQCFVGYFNVGLFSFNTGILAFVIFLSVLGVLFTYSSTDAEEKERVRQYLERHERLTERVLARRNKVRAELGLPPITRDFLN